MQKIITLLFSSTVLVSCSNTKLDATSTVSKQVKLVSDNAVVATSQEKTLPPVYTISPEKVLQSDKYSEGIVFDRQGTLYFSQTKAGTITVVSPDGSSRIWAKVQGANGHKILPDGTHIVAAKNSVVQLDANGKLIKTIANQFNGKPLVYPNDITVDPQGFYFTDSGDPNPQKPNGAVYYVDAAGKLNQIASRIAFANGVVLTPDRKRLFVSESNRNRILVYDVIAPGQLEQKKVFTQLPIKQKGEIDNKPDGLCLDAIGNLYVAHYGTRHIEVLNPTGQLVRRYASGNLTTSNCAFGGSNLKSLFVTGGVETEVGQGGIFRLDLGVQGLDIRPSQPALTTTGRNN